MQFIYIILGAFYRQLIEGTEELRVNQLYHGNLNLQTTYYDKASQVVKLANFKEKGKGILPVTTEVLYIYWLN